MPSLVAASFTYSRHHGTRNQRKTVPTYLTAAAADSIEGTNMLVPDGLHMRKARIIFCSAIVRTNLWGKGISLNFLFAKEIEVRFLQQALNQDRDVRKNNLQQFIILQPSDTELQGGWEPCIKSVPYKLALYRFGYSKKCCSCSCLSLPPQLFLHNARNLEHRL